MKMEEAVEAGDAGSTAACGLKGPCIMHEEFDWLEHHVTRGHPCAFTSPSSLRISESFQSARCSRDQVCTMAKGRVQMPGANGAATTAAAAAAVGRSKRIVNKHLHARVAYLDRISKYMASQQHLLAPAESTSMNKDQQTPPITNGITTGQRDSDNVSQSSISKSGHGLQYLYATHLRAVSLKSQVSLPSDVKRLYCKVCNGPFISGQTSSTHTENSSTGGKKPWADISVVRCLNCKADKRYPIGAHRQSKKSDRAIQALPHREPIGAGAGPSVS